MLIDTAQRLFAVHGIDRPSLREIAAAAGQRNVNAVQYHFTDRAGLVRAIYERNIPMLEQARAKRLAALRLPQRTTTPRDLIACFFMPLVENTDADGRRTYAAFQLQALKTPGWRGAWLNLQDQAPVTGLIIDMILNLTSGASREITTRHLIYANIVFLSMICDLDEMADSMSGGDVSAVIDDTIDLITRMCSPVAGSEIQ